MTPLVELRVLSGPSLGAAIELAAGTYVIGSDDVCDLIFAADTSVAERHLELRIHKRADIPEVRVRPLEGDIVIDGVDVPEDGASLANGEALGFGFSALAWQPIGQSWGTIRLAPLEFAGRVSVEKAAETETAGTVEVEDAEAAEESTEENVSSGVEGSGWLSLSRRELVRAGLFALVLVVLIVAVMSGSGFPPSPAVAARQLRAALDSGNLKEAFAFPPSPAAAARQLRVAREEGKLPGFPPSPASAARRLRAALDAAGFQDIQVETGVARTLVLRGRVDNDQALRRVFRLTDGLPVRVNVEEVRVGSDLLRITREILNTHGFFPEIHYRDSGDELDLALYLKDSMVETGMMASLSQDVPKLKTATRKVAYARDVAPVLIRELARIGLDGGQVAYLSGKVILPFRLDIQARQRLDAALETVRSDLGVPVFFQVTETPLDQLSGKRTITMESGTNSAIGVSDSTNRLAVGSLGDLKVMSVTLGAIPFVTMTDQQKFFPGAVLPGGATLVSIHADRLIIQHGEETITYPLKEES
jgi:type III secretion protein D